MSLFKRSARLDPRLLIGSLLVIASVFGVLAVVSAANRTTAVYVANESIAEGDEISLERLAVVEVPVSESTEYYLSPAQLPEQAAITTRPIGAGELVPISALGLADDTSAQVVVTISGALPDRVASGTAVELWAAMPGERPGTYDAPKVVVQDAQVVRVFETDQLVNSGQTELELRVPDAQLTEVLTAVTNGALLHVVPLHAGIGDE